VKTAVHHAAHHRLIASGPAAAVRLRQAETYSHGITR